MRVYDFTKMTAAQVLEARLELTGQQQRNTEMAKFDPNEMMRRNLRNPKVIDATHQKKRP